jgi:hypothetical protein
MTVHLGIHHSRQIISLLNMPEINRRQKVCSNMSYNHHGHLNSASPKHCYKKIKCQLSLAYSYQNRAAWSLSSDPCSILKLTKCHLSGILDMTVASSWVRCGSREFK